jgi:hypothetical protein
MATHGSLNYSRGARPPPTHLTNPSDGNWWPDLRPGLVSGKDLRDLVEVDAEQAAALMTLWTAAGRSEP